ncbi:MAG TPA: prephenate dehydratase [Clostridiaceae bacterium]|nr:prephenate dehydratase [Clostridiaceae bacterium]
MLKIGFLGPRGTFSHEAVIAYTEGRKCILCEYNSIPDILFAVEAGELDEAVVPIENSLEGAVNVTLDILALEVNLMIKHELVLAVKQNLMVKKGAKASDIRHVLSHPQAIGQCRKFIASKFPQAEIELVYSTANGAREVSEGDGTSAAIGSAAAAEAYNLDVLFEGIQDENNNLTRFVVVSKSDNTRTGSDKTSIVFSTEDRPGSLYRVLDIFNLWDINMTKIESRPDKKHFGRYMFFVDIEGHRQDQDVEDALKMVKRKTSFYKFLGSYPKYEGYITGTHENKNLGNTW